MLIQTKINIGDMQPYANAQAKFIIIQNHFIPPHNQAPISIGRSGLHDTRLSFLSAGFNICLAYTYHHHYLKASFAHNGQDVCIFLADLFAFAKVCCVEPC